MFQLLKSQLLKSFFVVMVMVGMLSVGAFAQNGTTAVDDSKQTTKTKVEYLPETIEKAQQALKAKGLYKGEVTGKLDETTKSAVKEFQKQESLNATGRLNKDTRQKLGIEAAETKDSTKIKDTTKSKSKKSTKTTEEGKS
jgi:peptidoglycan hydrolase-like protein with peptidoglycan-binding domain